MNYYDFNTFAYGYRNNYEYVRNLYPLKAKILLEYVEEVVDKYEYFGSFIYDEYLDKVTVYRLVNEAYEKYSPDKSDDEAKMIIEILLLNEIAKRRNNERY